MRGTKYILTAFMVCILLLPIITNNSSIIQSKPMDIQGVKRIKTLDIDIFFVGYEQGFDNYLLDELGQFNDPKPLYIGDHNTNISYALNFTYAYANQTYYDMLKTFILEHSDSGPLLGNVLDEMAVYYQLRDRVERDIFIPQSGLSIDAKAVEDWLVDNPLISRPIPRHTFYIFNFTEFDSGNHSIEHWYSNPITDPDSGELEDFWRLPWEGTLNEPMIFTFPGFQSDSRVYFLDPSASQWYLKWAYIWWQQQEDDEHTYIFNELDDIQWRIDSSFISGSEILADYLAEWLTDLINNLIIPNLLESDLVSLRAPNRNISIQILTLVENPLIDEVQWVVHENPIRQAYEEILPFFNWDIDVRFENMSNYPDIEAEIETQTLFIDSLGRHIDGGYFYNYFFVRRPDFFDLETSPITITCVNFAMENASLYTQGRDFTGLGGSGVSFIIMDRERFFHPDGSKKRGISTTIIHEIGHAIGLGHTFNHETGNYAGDFSQDVMGYYQAPSDFCGFRIDFFRRVIVDLEIKDILDSLEVISQSFTLNPQPDVIKQKLATIEDQLLYIESLYDHLDYVEALYEADNVIILIKDLEIIPNTTVTVNEHLMIVIPIMIQTISILIIIRRKQFAQG